MADPQKSDSQKLMERFEAMEEVIKAQKAQIELLNNRPNGSVVRDVINPGPEHAYTGLVRAKTKGMYGHLRQAGDIFEVKVSALWDDDWFEPIIETGADANGQSIYGTRPHKTLPALKRPIIPWVDVAVRDLKFN